MDKLIALTIERELSRILEYCIPVVLGIFIFIIPCPFNTAFQEISFYLSAGLLLLLILCRQTHFSFASPFTVPFMLFSLWVFICIPVALNKGNSFHDFYAHLLKHLVIFYLLVNYFKSKRLFIILSWIIVISITIFSIGGIIYFYFLSGGTLQGRFGLPEAGVDINHIGFLAIPAIFLTIVLLTTEKNLYKKLFLLAPLISTTSVVVLSGTRGALLGIFIPMLFLFMKNKKIVVIAIACILFLIIVTPIKDQLNIKALQDKIYEDVEIARLPIWYTYAQSIKEHPITGIGYGMQTYTLDFFNKHNSKLPHKYQTIVSITSGKIFYMPHNTLIDLTVRTGFVGLGLFLYCLYTFFRMGWLLYKNTKDVFIQNWNLCLMACCLSLLIQGMFVDLMIGLQVIYLFIFFAMINILWKINVTDNNLHDL
jgi:O-antigen ligase